MSAKTKRRLVVIGNGMAGARAVEEILARGGADLFEDLGLGGGAAGVPVADGVGGEVAVVADEAVVHGPGVDADRGRVTDRAQALQDAGPQSEDVPVEAAPHIDRTVGEPGGLGEVDPAVVDAGGHDASGGRAEVDGCQERHRRNPCGLPESTGMWTPVVSPRSGPTSA